MQWAVWKISGGKKASFQIMWDSGTLKSLKYTKSLYKCVQIHWANPDLDYPQLFPLIQRDSRDFSAANSFVTQVTL